MNTLLVIAVLASSLSSRAEPLDDLRAAESGFQASIQLARASTQQKPDIFRFDDARLPAYMTAAIDKAAAAAAAKEKAVLRTEIAAYENAVEADFKSSGQGCQQRFETAVADHARFQTLAAADMQAIHALQLQFRATVLSALAAGKGNPASAWTKIEADYQVMSALRKRYRGGSVDEVVASAERSGVEQMSRDSRVEIGRAKTAIAAAAEAQGLSTEGFYKADDLKLTLNFGDAEPELKACSGPYKTEREIPLKGSRGEKNMANYHSCVTAGLLTGKLGGDTLASAFVEDYTSQVIRLDPAVYAVSQVSYCILLEGSRRAFAQKP